MIERYKERSAGARLEEPALAKAGDAEPHRLAFFSNLLMLDRFYTRRLAGPEQQRQRLWGDVKKTHGLYPLPGRGRLLPPAYYILRLKLGMQSASICRGPERAMIRSFPRTPTSHGFPQLMRARSGQRKSLLLFVAFVRPRLPKRRHCPWLCNLFATR
jgi:hypothetical protein